jgi:hypothetical protein
MVPVVGRNCTRESMAVFSRLDPRARVVRQFATYEKELRPGIDLATR